MTARDTYTEVCRFYARQMHLLDIGSADAWAATFTEDGTFAPPSLPEPVRGRTALADGVRSSAAELAVRKEQRRHLMSMIDVADGEDGTLKVRSYAQIIATRAGETPRVLLMCVCEDVLVSSEGELLVRERRVTRDDMPVG
ncbi:nuclear transport factor 2 family protein [Streptomyces cyaneofuscatus]|uniref:nuclear transport factor 2 family protein n=1 Tax=Streptomyces cyaneofuscatus TaxID=66883 RepID=UPI0033B48EF8